MSQGTLLPLVAEIKDGLSSRWVGALMNEKGFLKSRETGTLWVSHPETGRILPWSGDPVFLELEKESLWYTAVLPEGTEPEPGKFILSEADVESHEETAATKETVLPSPRQGQQETFLFDLAETIRKRHKEMPEGSYTTHLFSKGLDKIRKKTGEEAIELLLARKREDIIFESGDLIYHLLVLLEASEVRLEEVLTELKRRDG